MESFYFIIVLALVLLAVSDLVVGVSNDAVNFLNSAFGSKVAKKKTILTVAAVGILVGALASSGMMEIARKGIFNPAMFSFADIMTIFLAVMITDILLLDLFNTFGLPTSTTVSIMFELLGAAFIVACIKIIRTEGQFSELGDYLNGSNALIIILGIFLSVFIAFTIGFFVQFIARLLFSFNLSTSIKKVAPLFGGIAITTIFYFLVIKGMKGSALVRTEFSNSILAHTSLFLLSMGVFWIGICYGLTYFFKINVLRVVVLFGTFSLAMAFAGNDLVNFIGVPIAGLQAYTFYKGSSLSADELGMGVLGEQIQTNAWILLAAGLIMILALRFSKKAQSVTETELNLARQSDGNERFKPSGLARITVRGGIRLGRMSQRFIGDKTQVKIQEKFNLKGAAPVHEEDKPSFDLVRAAVNLMVASVLIAFATSFKLPLSTTYVSFMVAMGTSLADKAWTRDSAVYRVAGVLHVISGWLVTALIAFSGAAVLALLIHFGGMVAISGLLILTVMLMVRSHLVYKKITAKYVHPVLMTKDKLAISGEEVLDEAKYRISITLFKVSCVLRDLIRGLEKEDVQIIKKAQEDIKANATEYVLLIKSFHTYLQKVNGAESEQIRFYLHALKHLEQLSVITVKSSQEILTHVQNLHQPFQNGNLNLLNDFTEKMANFLMEMSDQILTDTDVNWGELNGRIIALSRLLNQVEKIHLDQLNEDNDGAKNKMLFVALLLSYHETLFMIEKLQALLDQLNKIDSSSASLKERKAIRLD